MNSLEIILLPYTITFKPAEGNYTPVEIFWWDGNVIIKSKILKFHNSLIDTHEFNTLIRDKKFIRDRLLVLKNYSCIKGFKTTISLELEV